MRGTHAGRICGLTAVLLTSSLVVIQAQQQTHDASLWKYDGRDRAVGPGGPAPIHDLTGTWAGPRSGAGVRDSTPGDMPPLTPEAEKIVSTRRSLQKYEPAGTNDPVVRTCDPLGFPRADRYSIMAMQFAVMPDRIVVMYQFQQQWREIWMDGRELPKNVGAAQKDAPDPRYYGYSVGRWEDEKTLVVDTTGLDENTWLTDTGYPHSIDARVQERFTRTDYNDLELTITVNDPKFYIKPFSLGTEYFRWVPNKLLDERLCVPSQVIEYLRAVGDPAGKP